jgi:hypothetical protein
MATKELTITVTATPAWWFAVAYWLSLSACRVRPSMTDAVIAFFTKHAFNYRTT